MKRDAFRSLMIVSLALVAACDEPGAPGVVGKVAALSVAFTGDLTPAAGASSLVTDLRGAKPGGEGLDKVYDNINTTKLYLPIGKGEWIRYQMPAPAMASHYIIVSGNDAPERDPSSWTFEGSKDGYVWDVLDRKTNVTAWQATERNIPRTFTLVPAVTTPYVYYRLFMTENANTDVNNRVIQLSELRVFGSTVSGAPDAPTISSIAAAGNSVTLSWGAVSGATSYAVQRLPDDGTSAVPNLAFVTGTSYTEVNATPAYRTFYQVQAINESLSPAVRGMPSAPRAISTARLASGLQDITALSSVTVTDGLAGPDVPAESVDKVTDNSAYSKYFHRGLATLTLTVPSNSVVTQYTLTSANDAEERDPKSWILQGWSGSQWIDLDIRTDQTFYDRFQTRRYSCKTEGVAYSRYQLMILATREPGDMQLAEWRLYGTTTGATLAIPAVPTAVTATALAPTQVRVTWTDNAKQLNPESYFNVDIATNAGFSPVLATKRAAAGSTELRAVNLNPSTTYYFRVSAVNDAGPSSPSTTSPPAATPANTPPPSFVENGWYGQDLPDGTHVGHNRTVTRTYLDDNIALYYDQHVPSPATASAWMAPVFSEAWKHAKATYGQMIDPILYIIGNQDGTDQTNPIIDPYDVYGVAGVVYGYVGPPDAHDHNSYRNTAFSISTTWATDTNKRNWNFASLTHEMSHIIETTNNENFYSPSARVWGDSKFAGIFQYDLAVYLATKTDAQGQPLVPTDLAAFMRSEWQTDIDDYGAFWMRDWFYPIYSGVLGNTATANKGPGFLAKYYQLLAQHYPRVNNRYEKGMNLGEFIHFSAGAAGVDLLAQAKTAFRWSPLVEQQLYDAQRDYPQIMPLYNKAPVFSPTTITRSVTGGVPLAGQTLVGTATDPNALDNLTFTKVSGLTWLTISPEGALTGTPPTTPASQSGSVRVTESLQRERHCHADLHGHGRHRDGRHRRRCRR